MDRNITSTEFAMILDACQDGIYVTDKNLIGLYANQSFERITGIPIETWLGQPLTKMKEEGLISSVTSYKVLQQKQPVTEVIVYNNGNKAIITSVPTFNTNGKIDKIVSTVHNITEISRLSEKLKEINQVKEQYEYELKFLRKKTQIDSELIAKNPEMEKIVELISRISEIDVPILLLGESGVGKEVIANQIHKTSIRNKGPFIEVNCGAIPKELIESELFGYAPGAFTGAKKEGKPGLFELANKGTIFLDEIGDLPLDLQVKLLRVLQSLKVNRIGDNKSIQLDVRIIAATNKDLVEMVNQNEFREDLFYRLNVVPVHIPPLRDRKEDIPILAASFLEQFNKKYKKNKQLHVSLLHSLEGYHWPGNVRELKNLIERIVVLSDADVIQYDNLPYQYKHAVAVHPTSELRQQSNKNKVIEAKTPVNYELNLEINQVSNPKGLKDLVEEFEKQIIVSSLTRERNISRAAELLGVSQPTLSRKIQKYKIQQLIHYKID